MGNIAGVNLIDSFNSPIGQSILIGDLFSIFLSNAVFIAGFIIMFIIAIAGFSMVRGAGSNNPEQLDKGKKAITAAMIGFIVIFASYWIVQYLEILTEIEIFNPTGI